MCKFKLLLNAIWFWISKIYSNSKGVYTRFVITWYVKKFLRENKMVPHLMLTTELTWEDIVSEVNGFKDNLFLYKPDSYRRDTWRKLVFDEDKQMYVGDCESYALTITTRLYKLGVPLRNISLIYGITNGTKHVWLKLVWEGDSYLVNYWMYSGGYDALLIKYELIPIHEVNIGELNLKIKCT